MTTQKDLDRVGFIVDTDRPAHAFALALGAYLTGQTGETEAGEDEAANAREEAPEVAAWCSKHVVYIKDGWSNFAESYPTPGWFYDGMSGYYREGERDTDLVRTRYIAAVREHRRRLDAEFIQCRARDPGREAGWAAEMLDVEESTGRKLLAGPEQHTAYLSAVVWLDTEPPADVLAVWKQRATKYLEGLGARVTGFRLARVETVTTTRALGT